MGLLRMRRISRMLFFCSFLAPVLWSCTQNKVQWVAGWQSAPDLQIARAGAAGANYKDYVYVVGGVDGREYIDSIEFSRLGSDGIPGEWRFTRPLPEPRGFTAAAVRGDFLYVFGGANGPYGKNLLSSVIRAPIQSDGQLGLWQNVASMLTPRRCSKVFNSGNRFFSLGGFGGALLDTVESSHFNTDGILEPWQMEPDHLLVPRYVNAVKAGNGYVYVLGGHHPDKGVGLSSVEFSALGNAALTWRPGSEMRQGRYGLGAALVNDYLFALGGLSGAEYLASVERSKVLENGEPGVWEESVSLPQSMTNFTTIVVEERVLVLGGSTRTGYLADVYVASVNKQGELGFIGKPEQRKNEIHSSLVQDVLPNMGVVLKVIQTPEYTYLNIKKDHHMEWIAGPRTELAVGATVAYSSGVFMSDFYSKTLKQRFPSILFVGQLKVLKP